MVSCRLVSVLMTPQILSVPSSFSSALNAGCGARHNDTLDADDNDLADAEQTLHTARGRPRLMMLFSTVSDDLDATSRLHDGISKSFPAENDRRTKLIGCHPRTDAVDVGDLLSAKQAKTLEVLACHVVVLSAASRVAQEQIPALQDRRRTITPFITVSRSQGFVQEKSERA